MTTMDIDNEISTVLSTIRLETTDEEVIQAVYQLEDYYERKLWNQLTIALDDLFARPQSRDHNIRIRLFDQFLMQFHNKLNPIKVVDFLLLSFESPNEILEKLRALKESMTNELTKLLKSRKADNLEEHINNEESIVYLKLQIARYSLLINEMLQAEETLDALSEKFESSLQNEFSSKINAAFFLTKCQYYKLNNNSNLFYTNGLLYLSSLETTLLDAATEAFCFDLCIAALLGDKIFNFGELILHSILNSISAESNPYFWLYNLIQSLNAGNATKFNEWLAIAVKHLPLLALKKEFLHEKIVIMSFVELVSVKLATNKRISFSEISNVTGTPEDQVEYLVIRCFALNLIKGYIDQIEQQLVVTWLQPRILNLDQVRNLYQQLVNWDRRVVELGETVHKEGGSVWAGI